MLQLYAHELNAYYNYSIALGNDGRYRIKSAKKYFENDWGYFIIVNCEYAGFILLNHNTNSPSGTFINEFFILPRYRKGMFCYYVLSLLFSKLDGIIEYRVLKKNKNALILFDFLAKRCLNSIQAFDEYSKGQEYIRYTFNTTSIACKYSSCTKYFGLLNSKSDVRSEKS